MVINTIIDAIQLQTYLNSYKISTNLDIINYKTSYELSNYVVSVNTNIFYKDEDIVQSDVNWQVNVTAQEQELILKALNKLKLKLN